MKRKYTFDWQAACFFMLLPAVGFSQTEIERYVVANAGNYSEISNNIDITWTIGEVFVTTLTNGDDFDLTQGFQQPDAMLLPPLAVVSDLRESLCPDVKNGEIHVHPSGCLPPYSVTISKAGTIIRTVEVDDSITFTNLDSGLYAIKVTGATFCTDSTAYEITLKNQDCDLSYYSGITPNGDGKNDFWVIDNIEINYPNKVSIFSRWGTQVWNADNYDNQNTVFRGESKNGGTLPDGTYFYTIEVQNNPDASRSGWIQVTR